MAQAPFGPKIYPQLAGKPKHVQISISVVANPVNEPGGEQHASAGIDIQSSSATPGGTGFDIRIHLDDALTASDDLVESVFGLLKPLVVRCR